MTFVHAFFLARHAKHVHHANTMNSTIQHKEQANIGQPAWHHVADTEAATVARCQTHIAPGDTGPLSPTIVVHNLVVFYVPACDSHTSTILNLWLRGRGSRDRDMCKSRRKPYVHCKSVRGALHARNAIVQSNLLDHPSKPRVKTPHRALPASNSHSRWTRIHSQHGSRAHRTAIAINPFPMRKNLQTPASFIHPSSHNAGTKMRQAGNDRCRVDGFPYPAHARIIGKHGPKPPADIKGVFGTRQERKRHSRWIRIPDDLVRSPVERVDRTKC